MSYIAIPRSFSPNEAAIMVAWAERMDEIFREEGGPLDFYSDAIPVLVGIVHHRCPKHKTHARRRLIDKLVEFALQAEQTIHAEPMGRA